MCVDYLLSHKGGFFGLGFVFVVFLLFVHIVISKEIFLVLFLVLSYCSFSSFFGPLHVPLLCPLIIYITH